MAYGRSPRARGRRRLPHGVRDAAGSIPARAGETHPDPHLLVVPRVDPRARGGDEGRGAHGSLPCGRSPRARGRPRHEHGWRLPCGSIPARAGETRAAPSVVTRTGVDPRARGGDSSPARHCTTSTGRSPRARGRRSPRHRPGDGRGSIPARAGETSWATRAPPQGWVDPRARGGDRIAAYRLAAARGRSPRARGRRLRPEAHRRRTGSIPARAGETWTPPLAPPSLRVDPRARGGDGQIGHERTPEEGRSPRARGRQPESCSSISPNGSIPARAGETWTSCVGAAGATVDPRARGGDSIVGRGMAIGGGRSPRARGRLSRSLQESVESRGPNGCKCQSANH